jgi:hypothetical protein
LHQQYRTLATQPGPATGRHTFFFGGQDDGAHLGIGVDEANDMRVAGIGHIGHLSHPATLEDVEDLLLPRGRRRRVVGHGIS